MILICWSISASPVQIGTYLFVPPSVCLSPSSCLSIDPAMHFFVQLYMVLSLCFSSYLICCISITFYISIYLFESLCLFVFLSFFMSLFFCRLFFLSFFLSFFFSVFLSFFLSFFLFLSLSLFRSFFIFFLSLCFLYFFLDFFIYFFLPACLSVCLFVSLYAFICLPIFLPIELLHASLSLSSPICHLVFYQYVCASFLLSVVHMPACLNIAQSCEISFKGCYFTLQWKRETHVEIQKLHMYTQHIHVWQDIKQVYVLQ